MSIRRFQDADLPVVREVFRDAVFSIAAAEYNIDQCRAWAAPTYDDVRSQVAFARGLTLVAEDEGGVVAFGQLHPPDHVHFLYCRGRGRGRGHAGRILAELEAEARCRGVRVLTTEASLAARPFFARHGFRVVEREVVSHGGADLSRFRMRKVLAPEDEPMPTNADEVAAEVLGEAARELANALSRIRHCLDQLTDEQIWWRPAPGMNSVGHLLLHLSGNVRQWIVAGLGGATDVRDRPAEFADAGGRPKEELWQLLEGTVAEARRVLQSLSAAELMRARRIQGFEVSGLRAIFDTVPHFRGHTQEIIHLARAQLQERYRLAWRPKTPEEGAAS